MLEWGNDEFKELRKKIYQSIEPKDYSLSGRIFFLSTIIFTIGVEIGLSYAVHKQSIILAIPMVLIAGIVFYRYQFILHDCSHATLVKSRNENQIYGTIAGAITGYPFNLYKRNHSQHHLYTGTEKDFELTNFVHPDNGNSQSKQFITKVAHSFFLIDAYLLLKNLVKTASKQGPAKPSSKKDHQILYLVISAILQLALLNTYNDNSSIINLLIAALLLAISVGSITFTLNRIRGMCEHSIDQKLSFYNYTRTHNKSVINQILSPFNFNYHLEHHLFPELSSGNYADIHHQLNRIFPNRDWVSENYFKTIGNYLNDFQK